MSSNEKNEYRLRWTKMFKEGRDSSIIEFECIDGWLYAPETLIIEKVPHLAKEIVIKRDKTKVIAVEHTDEALMPILRYICMGEYDFTFKSVETVFITIIIAQKWELEEFIRNLTYRLIHHDDILIVMQAYKHNKKYKLPGMDKLLIKNLSARILNTEVPSNRDMAKTFIKNMTIEDKDNLLEILLNCP